MRVKDLPEISKLSTPEKILLVEDLWEHLVGRICCARAESHKSELDKRFKRHAAAPRRAPVP